MVQMNYGMFLQLPCHFFSSCSCLKWAAMSRLQGSGFQLKVILDQPVGHCEICIIYAVPPGNTNKVLYKEKKSSDSNEIMFFQNKQYMTLEVIGTENSTIQAIVFCILQGKAACSIQLLERASFRKGVDVLGFFAAGIGAASMCTSRELCVGG